MSESCILSRQWLNETRLSRDRDFTFVLETRSTMAKGIYPPMTVVDVIASLDAWGITVSQEQLSRPTQDFVEALYCACLRQAAQLDHNLLKGPVQELLDSSQIEEKVINIHVSAAANLCPFFRICTRLL